MYLKIYISLDYNKWIIVFSTQVFRSNVRYTDSNEVRKLIISQVHVWFTVLTHNKSHVLEYIYMRSPWEPASISCDE